MEEKNSSSSFSHRFFDSIIPLLTWLIITLPLWFSPFHPAVVAYFIIAFDLYFFYKALTTTYWATVSYKMLKIQANVPFFRKVKVLKNSGGIKHFVIIPNYQEPIHKLVETIETLVRSDYPHRSLYLVLAFEENELSAIDTAKILREKFGSRFVNIFTTFHPLKPNELQGKASNQTFAAKIVDEYSKRNGWDPQNVLITICDSDSHMPKNYFSYLTYEYLKDPENKYHFYWAPVLLYNNFWQLPFFVRIQATLSSILRLAFLSQKDKLIQISTYSTSLWLLRKIGFWDVDIIPEDWHVYLQAFFTFGKKVKTIPLYTIVNGDAVYSGGVIKTLTNRYEQEKRWAWGVSDIGYAFQKFFTTPHIPAFTKLQKIFFLIETHLLWPTSFFVLTVSASVPPLINPLFKRTVLGFLLPKLSGLILTFSSLMLVVYIYLDIKLRNRVQIKTSLNFLPILIIQWYLLPLVSFVLSSLPALEAHTRLLLGKRIKYKVTEKV